MADRLWSTLNVGKPKRPLGTMNAALMQWKPTNGGTMNKNAKRFDEYMEGLYPYEQEYAYQKAYVESMYRFFGYGMWLVFEKETGKLVGRAGIEHREELGGELELGYAIAKPYWGRGYATEVCQAIINYAKEELGFPSICSLIEPENAVSIHLAEKLGFQFEKEVKLTCKKYKKYVQKL